MLDDARGASLQSGRMSTPTGWLITRSGAIAPPSGGFLDAAYLVKLIRGSTTREVVVEFEESSAVVSNGYAEEVARRFLRDAEPPQHLWVDCSGTIRVLVGPREPTALSADPEPHEDEVEPRRARLHRRGASAL